MRKKLLLLGAVLFSAMSSFAQVNVEHANGADGTILPSFRWMGGSYQAYTYSVSSGHGYTDDLYNHVFGTPDNDANGNAWYSADFTINDQWTYGADVLPNNWYGSSDMGDVYAIRYFTVDGEIPGTLYMAAAHDDAPCEYYINGELIWAETDGWKEDEVVRLTDAQKALIKTDGSVNVFAFHVHQNWGGLYADGGLFTAGDPVNDFNNDVRVLDQTIALAQAEGVSQEAIDKALAMGNYRGGIGNGLAQIRKARRIEVGGNHFAAGFVGTAPADKMEAYLYNVGAGLFLAGGNDWGTHVSLNYAGAKCVLHANTSGANRYAIQTNLPNGRRGANDGLGHNGYVDCGYGDDFYTAEGWAWTFEDLGNGQYHIIQSGREGDIYKYLGMRDDDRLQVDTDVPGDDNLYNVWKIVTPAERDAILAAATTSKPADATYYIHQSTFSQNDFDGDHKDNANADLNDSAWERNAGSIWNWKGNDADGDYVFEAWNTAGAGKIYIKQVVEGLPAGYYEVSATGYYRDGSFESAIEGNDRQLANLYAGTEDNCVLLPSILEGNGKAPGYGREGNGYLIPDGCREAAHYFQFGTYRTSVFATVGEDGKLEIGAYRDAEDVLEHDWLTVDNFRLTYYGAITAGTPAFNVDEDPFYDQIEMSDFLVNGLVMTFPEANVTPDASVKVVADLAVKVPTYGQGADDVDGGFVAPQFQVAVENAEFYGDAAFGELVIPMTEFVQYIYEAGAGMYMVNVKSIEVMDGDRVVSTWTTPAEDDETTEPIGTMFMVTEKFLTENVTAVVGATDANEYGDKFFTVTVTVPADEIAGAGVAYAFTEGVVFTEYTAEEPYVHQFTFNATALDGVEVAEDEDIVFVCKDAVVATTTDSSYEGELRKEGTYEAMCTVVLVDEMGMEIGYAEFRGELELNVSVATGIQNVDFRVNEVTYNLAGQRVDAAAKGIVIKNGKKVVIK